MNNSYYINQKGEKVKGPVAKKKNTKSNIDPFKYANVGFYLLTPLLLGVIIGVILDRVFGLGKNIILLCIVLGSISSFYNLYKIVSEK